MQYLIENIDKVYDDELDKFVDCEDYSEVVGYFSEDFQCPLSKEALSLAKLLKLLKTEALAGGSSKSKLYLLRKRVENYASGSDLAYEDFITNIYDDMLQNLDSLQFRGDLLIFAKNSVFYTFKIKDKDKLSVFLTKYRIKHKIKPSNEFKELLETL